MMFSNVDHLQVYMESQPRRTSSRLPTNHCESLKTSITLKSILHKTYFSFHFMFFTPGFHNKWIVDRNTDYFLHTFLFQFIRLAYISWEMSLQQGMKYIKQSTHTKSVTPKSTRINNCISVIALIEN
jgi:hypothetical protein